MNLLGAVMLGVIGGGLVAAIVSVLSCLWAWRGKACPYCQDRQGWYVVARSWWDRTNTSRPPDLPPQRWDAHTDTDTVPLVAHPHPKPVPHRHIGSEPGPPSSALYRAGTPDAHGSMSPLDHDAALPMPQCFGQAESDAHQRDFRPRGALAVQDTGGSATPARTGISPGQVAMSGIRLTQSLLAGRPCECPDPPGGRR